MGVCQSGRYPIVVASQRSDISACVVFYGASQQRDWNAGELQPVAMTDMVAKLTVPSLFVFGEADHTISLDNVRRIRDALEIHRKSYRMHVLADAPHGFLNDTMPGRYRPCDTKVAWNMLLTFIQEVSGGQWPAKRVHWEFSCDSGDDYDFSKNVRLE
jgi:carboxymethylenebutenolidase